MRCSLIAALVAAWLSGSARLPGGARFSGGADAAVTTDTHLDSPSPLDKGGRRGVTTDTLLDELLDLERLTRLPDPAYVTKQSSSYNRASKAPDGDWFANGDRGYYVRVEDRNDAPEFVLLDVEGPGAVVRIWSADPRGVLRIYIDESDRPIIQADMKQLLGGELGWMPSPLAGSRAKGYNLYFPFAYARHCKVTCDAGNMFYHVNYRTFEAGTEVRSFTMRDLQRLEDRIAELAQRLEAPRIRVPRPADRRDRLTFKRTLPPRAEVALTPRVSGPAAISLLTARLQANDIEEAARGFILKMVFDGEQTVEAPIGDFFGTAPGLNPYESLPMGVTRVTNGTAEVWSRWVMPFAAHATLAVSNLSTQVVTIEGQVTTSDYEWNDRSLLFHAGWCIERDLPSRPFTDWTHLACEGKGRFVGGSLHIVNPVRSWWGEGDEKIYVDGEAFPSHFGTGSEDYYGYAWCCNELFTHAYHSQPRCDGPGNFGNTLNSRFHIIDDIPFTRSFRFDMENWHHVAFTRTTRAATSYWYARPGSKHSFRPITTEDVRAVRLPEYQVPHAPGAIEAEDLTAEATAGQVELKDMRERYSGSRILRWTGAKPGDRLTLRFDSDSAGKRAVIVRMEARPDAPTVRIDVNGRPAGETIDLHRDRAWPTDEIEVGSFDLREGSNRLAVEIVVARRGADKPLIVGLDYIRLK